MKITTTQNAAYVMSKEEPQEYYDDQLQMYEDIEYDEETTTEFIAPLCNQTSVTVNGGDYEECEVEREQLTDKEERDYDEVAIEDQVECEKKLENYEKMCFDN